MPRMRWRTGLHQTPGRLGRGTPLTKNRTPSVPSAAWHLRRLVSSVYPPIFLAKHTWEQGRQLSKAGPETKALHTIVFLCFTYLRSVCVFFSFWYVVLFFVLSVLAQVIVWKDLSPKWPIMYQAECKTTHSLTHSF